MQMRNSRFGKSPFSAARPECTGERTARGRWRTEGCINITSSIAYRKSIRWISTSCNVNVAIYIHANSYDLRSKCFRNYVNTVVNSMMAIQKVAFWICALKIYLVRDRDLKVNFNLYTYAIYLLHAACIECCSTKVSFFIHIKVWCSEKEFVRQV